MNQSAVLSCSSRAWLHAVLIVGLCTTQVLAQQASETPKDIELKKQKKAVALLEDEWLNGLNRANVDAIGRVLADDFVRPAPDSGRFVTKADILPYYRSHLKADARSQRRIENMTVTLYGSTALARGVVITSDSEGHVLRRLLFTDVFVQRNGKWQAVSAQENPITISPATNH